jgi:hypothetical protein
MSPSVSQDTRKPRDSASKPEIRTRSFVQRPLQPGPGSKSRNVKIEDRKQIRPLILTTLRKSNCFFFPGYFAVFYQIRYAECAVNLQAAFFAVLRLRAVFFTADAARLTAHRRRIASASF